MMTGEERERGSRARCNDDADSDRGWKAETRLHCRG